MDKYIGKKLDGRYEIRELIGVGGMANVYKAYDVLENRVVAVKILREEYMNNDEFMRRFRNESRAISLLDHPNIVKVYDVIFSNRIQSIVMEYIDGITLKDYIEQEHVLRWKEALHFTVQILRALQHAHDKGIVHRDIKPQNVMVLRDGSVKVADFGIACLENAAQTLTQEALGSVQHLAPSATDAFRGALSGPSIYFDFLNPLPLQVLAELTGAEGTALEGNARCLLLAAGADGSVHLYVWDGADTVLTGTVASTALSIDSLTEAVSQSGMGSVSFAFEVVEMEPLYGKLFPLSILPTELPQLPVLSAASSISGTDWLLAAFGFNINTRERYAEADGTEVITEVEADRSLHIRPSGEITYRSGTDATLEISAQEEVPTAAEAVLGASILLEQLTEDRSGEARLYLESVSQGGDTTQLLFGYQIDGVPIRFSDGGHAAEITLSGTSVTRLTLRFRQYSTAGETSLLLPLRQTLAIAAEHPGTELSVGYADGGGDSVSASWLAD